MKYKICGRDDSNSLCYRILNHGVNRKTHKEEWEVKNDGKKRLNNGVCILYVQTYTLMVYPRKDYYENYVANKSLPTLS